MPKKKNKKKTEWTTHKHACSSKFPDLVLTEITTPFLNLTLLRACYFRHTIGPLTRFVFLTKILRLILWVLGSLMTCAFMASSLRLSACFIYDKRAWVIYCSLSWQWYIFETSNITDKIYFIIFSGRKWETMLECSAHNKTSLVTSVYNMFLLLFTSAGSHTYGHECAIYTVQC